MDDRVREFYELRPLGIRNSADDEPVDNEKVNNLRRFEQGLGSVCTQADVSVTISVNE